MFHFVKSNCMKIYLPPQQKEQLSSDARITEALSDTDVTAFDIYKGTDLIGFAMLRRCTDGWFLWDYAIDFRFQNLHYGQAVLTELCQMMKEKGANWITTTYKFGNGHAKHVYEKVGFVQTDIVCENGIHEVNMLLSLC